MVAKFSTSPLIFFNALAIVLSLLAPLTAGAEIVTFDRTTQTPHEQYSPLKKVRLALDDDGNVMLRFRRVSLTFIYEADSPAQDSRLQSGVTATRQEVACLGGVSVKFGLTF